MAHLSKASRSRRSHHVFKAKLQIPIRKPLWYHTETYGNSKATTCYRCWCLTLICIPCDCEPAQGGFSSLPGIAWRCRDTAAKGAAGTCGLLPLVCNGRRHGSRSDLGLCILWCCPEVL